mmetsp:Transcript_43913/g.82483  ORF Transcript_43913/g.82483 Transcript_43913/m.82483 type:complete len:217 (-) Transcript_43913:708-1358(-)
MFAWRSCYRPILLVALSPKVHANLHNLMVRRIDLKHLAGLQRRTIDLLIDGRDTSTPILRLATAEYGPDLCRLSSCTVDLKHPICIQRRSVEEFVGCADNAGVLPWCWSEVRPYQTNLPRCIDLKHALCIEWRCIEIAIGGLVHTHVLAGLSSQVGANLSRLASPIDIYFQNSTCIVRDGIEPACCTCCNCPPFRILLASHRGTNLSESASSWIQL